ncbi:type II secretion system protein GspL [Enterobacter chuandaensis]|uniref:type II secretion system protein GspL n=1 Tax=Enterobacter chuandaensis TaxID=2497875 RepID=UPI003D6E324B
MSSETLLLRISAHEQDTIEWCILNGHVCGDIQRLETTSLQRLASLPAARNTHVLLPVSRAIFSELSPPTNKAELTPQQIQWLADETLDQDALPHYWTVIHRNEEQVWAVGLETEWFVRQLNICSDAGLSVTHVTLDALCLPVSQDGWTTLTDRDGWLLRPHAGRACSVNDAWLIHLIARFAPRQLISFGALPESYPAATLQPSSSIQALYTQGATPNLLQGKYLRQTPRSPVDQRLKRIACYSLILAAAVLLGSRLALFWQLQELEHQLYDDLNQQWNLYIPENRHTGHLRTYLPKQLQQRFPAPAVLLQRIQTVMATYPDLALEGLRYDRQQRSLQLFIFATEESQIQHFINDKRLGLKLRIDRHEQSKWTLHNE